MEEIVLSGLRTLNERKELRLRELEVTKYGK